jgi:hypothetical protein
MLVSQAFSAKKHLTSYTFLSLYTNVRMWNFAAGNNNLQGDLPEAMALMISLNEVNLQGNHPSFAGNINEALCGQNKDKVEKIVMGGECPLPVCLCCANCPN